MIHGFVKRGDSIAYRWAGATDGSARPGSQPGFELGQGFGHIASPVAETDVVGFVVDRSGEQQDTSFANELVTKILHGLRAFVTGEPDGAGVRQRPFEEIIVAREEGGELAKITQNDLEIAVDEFLTMAKRKRGEEFTGGAGANGRVVFERDNLFEEFCVAAGQPAEA
jgi:hypothetical protein